MILRWRPNHDLWDMYGRISKLFEDEMRETDEAPISSKCWKPVTDIFETKEAYVFKLELPGVQKENIKIEIEGERLSISGEKKEEDEVKKEDFHRVERSCGSFTRNFQLPKNANGEKMNAKMKDGILELRVPKQEEAKAKSIAIDIK